LVNDLALQRVQIGSRTLQCILVRPGVDLEEQSALLDKSVVLHRERRDGTIYLRCDADEIGEDLRVVSARIPVGLVYHQQASDQRGNRDRHAHNLSQTFSLNRSVGFSHSLLYYSAKEHKPD